MTINDPIADMLTRVRNANMVRHDKLELPASNIKKEIAEILKSEGFIKNVEYVEDDKQGVIRLFLKYGQNNERRSEEHTSELQSRFDLVCRLLLEKKTQIERPPCIIT